MWEILITPKHTTYLTRIAHVLPSFYYHLYFYASTFPCFQVHSLEKGLTRRNEAKQRKNGEKRVKCTHGVPHGVSHRGSREKDDVFHVPTVTKTGSSHFGNMAVANFDFGASVKGSWRFTPMTTTFLSHKR